MINDAAYFTHALARLVCFVTKVRKMDVYEADPHTQDRNLAQAGGASGESVSLEASTEEDTGTLDPFWDTAVLRRGIQRISVAGVLEPRNMLL